MMKLFSTFQIKGLELKNRIVMPPMCQYAVEALDGKPTDWHLVHYASRAVGGVGLIIMEMTDVEPDGRISDRDLGLWSDDHIEPFQRVISTCHQLGAKIGVQIGHAGRKAMDAHTPVAPSAIRFPDSGYRLPRALGTDEVHKMVDKYRQAVRRAVTAGADTIELHGAHGYLIHQFHSPLTNQRTDEYGTDLARFGCEVIAAVKREMPQDMPLLMRISAVEYVDGGYGLDHMIPICRRYKEAGVDMFHVSSGGEGLPARDNRPGNFPGYMIPLSRAIKSAVSVPVISVGMLDDPYLAEAVTGNGDADLVALGRGLLRDPYWPLHAADVLKEPVPTPHQYERAFL